MILPLPFPKCSKCGSMSERSKHKNCGGSLYIDEATDQVSCEKCRKKWNVWDSRYNCRCGNIYSTEEVKTAFYTMLAVCKVAADEQRLKEAARESREKIARHSIETFILGLLEGASYALGLRIGPIVDIVWKLLKQ